MNIGNLFNVLYLNPGAEFPGSSIIPTNFKDKIWGLSTHSRYLLAKTNRMFKWGNLPEGTTRRYMELILQTCGFIAAVKYNGKIIVTYANFGDGRNQENFPKKVIVNNAYSIIPGGTEFEIGKDAVVIFNDSMLTGLLPHVSKYGTLLTEVDLSIYICTILTRLTKMYSGADSGQKAKIEDLFKQVLEGDLTAVIDDGFAGIDNIKALEGTNGSVPIQQLLELRQYLEGKELNELGFGMSWNNKREYVSSDETIVNSDHLDAYVDDMLKCREEGIEEWERVFGNAPTVEFDSIWADSHEKNDLEMEILEKEAKEKEEGKGEKENAENKDPDEGVND